VITEQQVAEVMGATTIGLDGDKIGKVADIYLDEDTGAPQWVAVKTGLFGSKQSLVPAARCHLRDDGDVEVPFDKATVKDAPNFDTDDEYLSAEQEAQLDRYYRDVTAPAAAPFGETVGPFGDTVGPDGGVPSADRAGPVDEAGDRDAAMTRSEERLEVGTERVVTGRVRLRKYVVTENVQATVPLSHEEVRIEREPIAAGDRDAATSEPGIGEAEQEVVLYAERPVVQTRIEPVERVRLATETVTEQQTVSGQVRKERIATDGLE
jgi:uncharacterized protein (TIGR02271 family)